MCSIHTPIPCKGVEDCAAYIDNVCVCCVVHQQLGSLYLHLKPSLGCKLICEPQLPSSSTIHKLPKWMCFRVHVVVYVVGFENRLLFNLAGRPCTVYICAILVWNICLVYFQHVFCIYCSGHARQGALAAQQQNSDSPDHRCSRPAQTRPWWHVEHHKMVLVWRTSALLAMWLLQQAKTFSKTVVWAPPFSC